jgi:hypothetical protein
MSAGLILTMKHEVALEKPLRPNIFAPGGAPRSSLPEKLGGVVYNRGFACPETASL